MKIVNKMFSYESDLFEVEENEVEFQEICSRLKNHTFPSPWEMFFKTSNENEFTSEVSEFVADNVNIVKDSSIAVPPNDRPLDIPSDTFMENHLVLHNMPIDKKKVCRLKECLMNAQDDSTIESIKDFDIFFTIPSNEIQVLLEILDVSVLNDTTLSLILNAFLHFKDQISIATATALIHHMIFPLIFDKENSSRFLLTTILKFAEIYPKAVIDEILIPYSKKETSDDSQSEIILQIAKTNLPSEYISYTIKNILENAIPVDNSFTLLQCLIERKVHHDSVLYDLFFKKLLNWTSQCNKNIKFTKLLTSILSAYGSELTEQQVLLCEEVVKRNKTIIKKAAENLLKRLKQEKF